MKKIIFMLLVTFMVASCGNQSKEIPLINDLVIYTYNENDSTFMGVKYANSDDVVINPDAYLSIDADSCIIRTINQDNRVEVYNHQGVSIGGISFDSFVKIKMSNDGFYYLGKNYDKKFFYYPKTKTFIAPIHFYQNMTTQCLITDDTVFFYDHSGNRLSKLAKNDILYLLEIKDKSYYIVMSLDDNVKTIFDVHSNEVKKLNKKQWAKFENTLSKQTTIDNFVYAIINEI